MFALDSELCQVIEKTAAFIASQGPAAGEAMRAANFGNPRMAFLYNGDGAAYYQYRLATEINNRSYFSYDISRQIFNF